MILFLSKLDDYVKIHTNTRSYLTLLSMKKLVEKLPEKQFVRIHKSYIVPIEKKLCTISKDRAQQ